MKADRMTMQLTIARVIVVIAPLMVATVSTGTAQTSKQPAAIVFFTNWSALLDPDAQQNIKKLETVIKARSGQNVTVTGYADVSGSSEANNLLSGLRAQVVIDQLVADGIPANRLRRVEHGATPDSGVPTESRRVVVTFTENR